MGPPKHLYVRDIFQWSMVQKVDIFGNQKKRAYIMKHNVLDTF